MHTHADKLQEKKQDTNQAPCKKHGVNESTFQLIDKRPQAIAQKKLINQINNSPQIKQLKAFQDMANHSPKAKQAKRLQDKLLKHPPHQPWHVVQRKQGKVAPTMQMKGEVIVNDDAGIEKEADVNGHNLPVSIYNSVKQLVINTLDGGKITTEEQLRHWVEENNYRIVDGMETEILPYLKEGKDIKGYELFTNGWLIKAGTTSRLSLSSSSEEMPSLAATTGMAIPPELTRVTVASPKDAHPLVKVPTLTNAQGHDAQAAWKRFQRDHGGREFKVEEEVRLAESGIVPIPHESMTYHHVYPQSALPGGLANTWDAVRLGPSERLDPKGNTLDPSYDGPQYTPRSQASMKAVTEHKHGTPGAATTLVKDVEATIRRGARGIRPEEWFVSAKAVDTVVKDDGWTRGKPQRFFIKYAYMDERSLDMKGEAEAYAWPDLRQETLTAEGFGALKALFASSQKIWIRHGEAETADAARAAHQEEAMAEQIRKATEQIMDLLAEKLNDKWAQFRKEFKEIVTLKNRPEIGKTHIHTLMEAAPELHRWIVEQVHRVAMIDVEQENIDKTKVHEEGISGKARKGLHSAEHNARRQNMVGLVERIMQEIPNMVRRLGKQTDAEPLEMTPLELEVNRLLGVNNYLINAIALAAGLRMPNLGQLLRIREEIGDFGGMLFASEGTIGIIRAVLGIERPIAVIYRDDRPSEDFPGSGDPILIYHVNGHHFTHQSES